MASTRVALGDADHDGDLDVLVLGPSVSLLANDGEARFAATGQPAGSVGADRAAFSDLDNDRDVDIVLLAGEGLRVQTNIATARFRRSLMPWAWVPCRARVWPWRTSTKTAIWTWRSRLTVPWKRISTKPVGLSFGAEASAASGGGVLLAADFDNDGDLDLLVGEDERLQPLAYGGGQFQPQAPIDEPGGAALVADFNGDGRVDIWAGGGVLHNQSEGGALDRDRRSGA